MVNNIIFLGKEYSWEKTDDKVRFLIDGHDGSESRKNSFYKFYALNRNSVEALTHPYIYATHPCQLNDPLDCADDLIDFDDFDTARSLSLFGNLYSEVSEMCNYDEESIIEFEKVAFRTYYYMRLGIFSLTKNSDDISMWSAYTNHKGFCIEFDVNKIPYDLWGPFPLNYQKELNSVSLKNASLPLASLIQTNVKLDCWEHEQEWRLLIQCPEDYYMEPFGFKSDDIKSRMSDDLRERKLDIPLQCFKSVCLGSKFFDNDYNFYTEDQIKYIPIGESQEEVNLKNEILSFLTRTKINTYCLMIDNLRVVKQPIEIMEIKDNAFLIRLT